MTKEERMDMLLENLDGATRELNASLASIDKTVTDAVDSGIESGRVLGFIEAYDFLVKRGYVQSAKTLRDHIDAVLIGPDVPKA